MTQLFRFTCIRNITCTNKKGSVNDATEWSKFDLAKSIAAVKGQKDKEEAAKAFLKSTGLEPESDLLIIGDPVQHIAL